MDKKDRIKALMSNEHSPVRTQAALEAMSDKELDGLEAHVTKKAADIKAAADKEAKEKADKEAKEKADKEAANRAASEKPETDEEWLKKAPESVRSLVSRAAAQEARQKTVLVARLKDAQKEYTEDELKAMSVDQLVRLARLAIPTETRAAADVDFSGLGLPAEEPKPAASAEIPNGYRAAMERRKQQKGAVN